jgi:hypothetical protein
VRGTDHPRANYGDAVSLHAVNLAPPLPDRYNNWPNRDLADLMRFNQRQEFLHSFYEQEV